MIAAVFDTETTGLIENHTVKLHRQPEVIEFACRLVTWEHPTEVHDTYSTLIRPTLGRLPDETKRQTHLTDEDLADQPTFLDVSDRIIAMLLKADVVVGHNLSFDMEMIDLEMERLSVALAWPRQKVCTVEQTVHHFGRRIALGELYRVLTGEEHTNAHRALGDVDATIACLMEMRRRDWL